MHGSTRQAFIFVEVEPGHDESVVHELLEIEGVYEVHLIAGRYDVVACLEVKRGMMTDSTGEIVDLVKNRIRRIKGVQDTETIISQEVFHK
jgi:DNA-binding Lrp family transcriptional regulator